MMHAMIGITFTTALLGAVGLCGQSNALPTGRISECQAVLDDWCMTSATESSPKAPTVLQEKKSGSCAEALGNKGCNNTHLYARYGLQGDYEWRCYSSSALSDNLTKFKEGSTCFCTRNTQLRAICKPPCNCPSPPTPSPPPGQVDALVSGTGGYHTYRIPAIVRLPNGHLLLFAEGRKLSSADHGWNDIVVTRSTDNGASWLNATLVYGEATPSKMVTIGNPSPIALTGANAGKVVLVACRNNIEVLVLRSSDYGYTWSDAEYITKSAVKPSWTWVATGPPQGLELQPSGRLLISADHKSGDAFGSHSMYSDDHGATWTLGGSIVDGNECQAARTANGSLIMNMRSQLGHRLFAWSHDNGVSWSPPTSTPFFNGLTYAGGACEGSTISVGTSLIFSTPFSTTSRANMTLFRSVDNGASWEFFKNVDPAASAYSALTPVNETHFGLAWETRSYGAITYNVFQSPSQRR
eukprot:m.189871 g.189871  ORF g.189871 m.189871 type:complete len:468 (+) comp18535_c0_seq4:125-1528(+)